ncbi:putative Integral membrane protein [Candidatus Competibacter denitrificans Run_A_D11]|uniref:Integral membrane protein n=1 Tax=Candidatus Competibacter denitrificans Run_A_D11 TaxID=1400863 RepID=W6M6P7_9GAMM|nr:DMT family transporter [Candidatus Competibacter denitrificans]CDI03357.1 putative Integral membrane protein [Candidatus Competibacter denitrificans Run_A_D11]HAS85494.1 EamA family transporter [Candidatus Competibacteraceae bacterium]HRC68964.1 DMT family transporter [Candidatus Competibacter denitrificans]
MTISPSAAHPTGSGVSPRTALVLLLFVIILWGANWPVMKVGLHFISPLRFVAARMVMGAVILFGVAAMLGELRWPSRRDWPIVLAVGAIQMAAFMALTTVALQFVPAGRSAILAYTTPLWVTPLAIHLLGERLNQIKLYGLLCGLGGVAVLFNPSGFDWSDPHVLLGNGLLLAAALAWALLIVQVRRHHWQGSPLSLGPWQFSVASALLVPLALVFEADRPWQGSVELGWVLLYNGPLATAFCFWAMLTINRALPAITTSLGSLGVPAFGLLASTLALGEPVTLTNVLGFLLIAGGVVGVILADRR